MGIVTLFIDNCIDRHAEVSPDRVALVWEKDEPNQHECVTYRYLCVSMYGGGERMLLICCVKCVTCGVSIM